MNFICTKIIGSRLDAIENQQLGLSNNKGTACLVLRMNQRQCAAACARVKNEAQRKT